MDYSLSGVLWRLASVLILVFANGFFVASEFAIVTVRKTRVDQLIAEGNRRARTVGRAVAAPDRYIAATQLGITMASLGLGWIGEPALASIIQPPLKFLPAHMAEPTAHSIAVIIAFTVITAVEIVFGELAPKWTALEQPETTALWVVRPTEVFMRALWPFIRVLHGFAKVAVRAVGLRGADARAMVHSEEELKMLVTASQEAGVLEEEEEQMLHRVFGFGDLTAAKVMIPRTELVGVDELASRETVLEVASRSGYARLPVYRENIDNVIGILHVTDLVKAVASETRRFTAGEIAREALTVPEALRADDLLAAIRRRGVREALVIDEFGVTAGLVTFDSLVERIVGELGTAASRGRIVVNRDGSAVIDGLVLAADVNERFGLAINEDLYATLGGYVAGQIGRRVRIGDVVEVDGRQMRVLTVDGLRVAKVWLSKPVKEPTAKGTERTEGS
jgi:CBS domain containing-hemolysin-like protein